MGKILDQRSDVFSLGLILYEWITGYRLFTGENEMAILKQIIEEKIYPPSYFREEIPEDVEAILMRALEKNRDKRYQSAREMQLEIHQTLSRSEFSPSNAHLAAFMEQMFSEEVEQEQKFLAEAAQVHRTLPPPAPGQDGGQLQAGELIGRAKKASDSPVEGMPPMLVVVEDGSGTYESSEGQELRLQLGSREMRRLREAAERSQNSVEDIIEDILRASLKYL
jgi:serine/threonine-protein kinase